MNETLKKVYELQTVEFGETLRPETEARIAALRAAIPASILSHYDRLADSGKRGVAPVRNQACSGCHISVPLGTILELRRAETIRLCDNCRRYLYLSDEPAAAPAPVPAPKKRRKHLVAAV